MKKIIIILIAMMLALPLLATGCYKPGPTETRQFTNSGFTNLQVGSAFQVTVTPSSTYGVSITAARDQFDHMTVRTSGGTLEVSMEFGFWNFWHSFSNRPKLEVSMPELDMLDVSGATTASALGFSSNKDFKMQLSGASTASIDIQAHDASITVSGASHMTGNIDVHDLRLNVSGASNVNLNGKGNSLNLDASGASTATLNNLPVGDARAEISGASRGIVNASGKLDIYVSGASTLDYYGNPSMGTVDVTGASNVHQK
jgi:hypothetical protein